MEFMTDIRYVVESQNMVADALNPTVYLHAVAVMPTLGAAFLHDIREGYTSDPSLLAWHTFVST